MNHCFSRSVPALVVCGLLVACSSSSDDDSETEAAVSKIGSVSITDFPTDGGPELIAFFYETAEGSSISDVLVGVDPGAEVDTCEVSFDSDDAESPFESSNSIDAGETITFSSPAGTYAELQPQSFAGQMGYRGPDNLSTPVPSGLILDIPGGEFPAFSAVPFPDVEPFVLTSDLVGPFEEIPVSEEITWEPGTDPDARIELYYLANESRMNSDGIEEEIEIDLDCVLLDDGSFSFDAELQARLVDAGFDTVGSNIGRQNVTTVRQGDAMLIVANRNGDL